MPRPSSQVGRPTASGSCSNLIPPSPRRGSEWSNSPAQMEGGIAAHERRGLLYLLRLDARREQLGGCAEEGEDPFLVGRHSHSRVYIISRTASPQRITGCRTADRLTRRPRFNTRLRALSLRSLRGKVQDGLATTVLVDREERLRGRQGLEGLRPVMRKVPSRRTPRRFLQHH